MSYIKNQIKRFVSVIFIIALAIQCQAFASLNNTKKPIPIIFYPNHLENQFYPKWLEQQPDYMVVMEILPSEKVRSKRIIELAKSKYPDKMLQNNLKSILVFKYISFHNVPYSGTTSDDCVLLTNDGIKNGYTDKYIEAVFHHELAHMLLKKYYSKFDSTLWSNINPKNFKYLSSGFDAVKTHKASSKFDPNFLKKGFLDQYSQSDKDEDFCEIVQGLFTGGKEFWNIVDKYPKIKKKVNLAIDFYHKVDPSFNEKFFRNLISK